MSNETNPAYWWNERMMCEFFWRSELYFRQRLFKTQPDLLNPRKGKAEENPSASPPNSFKTFKIKINTLSNITHSSLLITQSAFLILLAPLDCILRMRGVPL